MFNPHTKPEVSTITCNEEMKSNAKLKILVLSQPLGDFGVMHRVYLWLEGKRTVNFLLTIIKLFWLALVAVVLLSEICGNWHSLKGWVTLSANFR